MSLPAKNKFDPSFPIVGSDRRAEQVFRDYMTKLDLLISTFAAGNLPVLDVTKLTNAANDAAAAAAGVIVGGVYRNGSILMVRVV